MKHILFVTISSGVAPSTRVRVNNLIPELAKFGYSARVARFPKGVFDKCRLLWLCTKSDIVFLQKRLPTRLYAELLRMFSRKLVYDFDDAIYYRPNVPNTTRDQEKMRRFINILRKSDLVIAGNSILAAEAERYTPHCRILPSAVETRNIAVKDYAQANDRFVIGWVGGNINLPCLKALSQVLQNLARRHAIEVRVISGQSVEIPGVECRFIPWHEDTQEKEIAQFDVGVMPLFDYPHTQGKCAYKALQYMAAGVPPVVSDVGINKQVVKHGVSGYVAKNLPDFEKYIEKLIMDRKLLRDMGSAAKSRVTAHFSIERVGQDLARLLN